MHKKPVYILLSLLVIHSLVIFISGCAQMAFPTGGDRDSLAPVLIKANPQNKTLHFTGNKITLSFDEYIELQDLQNNLVVSPWPLKTPIINSNLKTISIRLRDSLKPNTTYSIQFGNAIKDNNEGNVYHNLLYVFSTGDHIDSLTLAGQVTVAETGATDSTLLVLLYKDLDDSAVIKSKPDYIARLDNRGGFLFQYLPAGKYNVFALKDGDGGKTYNSKSELFAFLNEPVTISPNSSPVQLFASSIEKEKRGGPPATGITRKNKPTALVYRTSIEANRQDILSDLTLVFSTPLTQIDSNKIILSDTLFMPVPFTLKTDSTAKTVSLHTRWQPDKPYLLLIPAHVFKDSLGFTNEKADTIRFSTKREEDYAAVELRFQNLDLSLHPVLQFIVSDTVFYSAPVTSNKWKNKQFLPGTYGLRILYDANENGVWDTGNYNTKTQPERVIPLPDDLKLRANWDNERDILVP